MNITSELVNVYRIVETHTVGCPEDGSERSETQSRLVIIPLEKDEAFNEGQVSNYESQDYGYHFDYRKVLSVVDLKDIQDALNEFNKEYTIEEQVQ